LGCGIGQAGSDVLGSQFREVGEQFLDRHAARQVFENVPNRDSHPADAGLTAPLAWLDGNEVRFIPIFSLSTSWRALNERKGNPARLAVQDLHLARLAVQLEEHRARAVLVRVAGGQVLPHERLALLDSRCVFVYPFSPQSR
jgi:hypothetical protein